MLNSNTNDAAKLSPFRLEPLGGYLRVPRECMRGLDPLASLVLAELCWRATWAPTLAAPCADASWRELARALHLTVKQVRGGLAQLAHCGAILQCTGQGERGRYRLDLETLAALGWRVGEPATASSGNGARAVEHAPRGNGRAAATVGAAPGGKP